MEQSKLKKIGNTVLNVLLYIFLAICIFMLLITVLSKKDSDGAANIFGYQMRVVTSDSMAKCEFTDVSDYKIKHIPIRSMVFVKIAPEDPEALDEWYRSLKKGDVLTFRYVYTTQVTITHRLVSDPIAKQGGGYILELVGDNVTSESDQLRQTIDTSIPDSYNYVIGKVTGTSYLLGLVLSFLMQPLGMVLVIILPCFVIILLEIIKIVRVVTKDKRDGEKAEMAKKESELEELRRRLAELEKGTVAQTPAQTTDTTSQSTQGNEEET